MKTFNYIVLTTAFIATSTTALSWRQLSREAKASNNVKIPSGTYTVRCNDNGKANGLWLSKHRGGLLHLSPHTSFDFEIEPAIGIDNGFKMFVNGSDGQEDKYISGKRMKRADLASYIVAKPSPSFEKNNNEVFNVYLQMISTQSNRQRWYRAGRSQIGSHSKLRLAHHKMSQWTLTRKYYPETDLNEY